jgi:hypothetical protein
MQTHGQKLTDEQELLTWIADIVIDVFLAESALLRAQQAAGIGAPVAALEADAARVFVNDAAARIEANARQALAAMAEGDNLRTQLAALRRILKVTPIDTVRPRRRIADAIVARRAYVFNG